MRKYDAIEQFFPERMASRILGMGDVISLVEKAQQAVNQEQAEKLEKKLRREDFNLEDFFDQLQQLKKMGPLDQLLNMIPGLGSQLRDVKIEDKQFGKLEAIISSMTVKERQNPRIINGSRRRRIAGGSGTRVQDINQFLNQFGQMKKMIQKMKRMPMRGLGKIPLA